MEEEEVDDVRQPQDPVEIVRSGQTVAHYDLAEDVFVEYFQEMLFGGGTGVLGELEAFQDIIELLGENGQYELTRALIARSLRASIPRQYLHRDLVGVDTFSCCMRVRSRVYLGRCEISVRSFE